ncbi:uncharacterized protein LOC105182720 isoform X2 [Harpegnathos saltator]|uniref:uncharacterized protein LOC105182720 isoform X2 n=1 Tax=Harpegnathos saltator TaxID=610380 RepID=UPI000948CEDD|nr:uncharacterized protein LOC105182720 isoform X2 [Harpegnathos saltator]
MFPIVSKYYDLNRMLLLASGLWPYRKSKSKFRHVHAASVLVVILSFIVFQLTVLINTDCTINLVTKVLSIVLLMFVCVLKYNIFFFNADKMKLLMDLMWYHWTIIQDKREIAILEKHSRFTRRFTMVMTQIFSLGICVVAAGHCLPAILDIIVPLNSSRPRHFYILMEYFVDQERYFLPILLHVIVSLSVGSIIILSVGTMIMAYMQHACAMLKIASFRIGNAVPDSAQTSFSRNDVICERIISGVQIHRKAIEFIDLILSNFKVPFFFVMSAGVASIAFSILQVFVALLEKDMNEIIITIIFVIVQFFYMYIGNYAGQLVADHYIEVFDVAYCSYWYVAPLRAQKFLLFIMQRTTKNFYFVFGGIFMVSLKGFSTLASMSISYFTVIYSFVYTR